MLRVPGIEEARSVEYLVDVCSVGDAVGTVGRCKIGK